jgi:hypothetical protein
MTEQISTAPTNPSDSAQQQDYPLSAGDAAQKLVDMSAAFRAANPTPNELSPEQAEQRLGEMAAAYKKANRERLPARDAEIVGDDRPPEPFATTHGGELSLRNTLRAIEDLRHCKSPIRALPEF